MILTPKQVQATARALKKLKRKLPPVNHCASLGKKLGPDTGKTWAYVCHHKYGSKHEYAVTVVNKKRSK